MMYEYDTRKSQLNKLKHGVSFEEAKEIWEGACIDFAAKSDFENRYAIIGPIDKKLYTCIYTLRGKNIRIISCRRSRENERKLYEENIRQT